MFVRHHLHQDSDPIKNYKVRLAASFKCEEADQKFADSEISL